MIKMAKKIKIKTIKKIRNSLIEKSLLNSGTLASEQDHTDTHTLEQRISVMDFN